MHVSLVLSGAVLALTGLAAQPAAAFVAAPLSAEDNAKADKVDGIVLEPSSDWKLREYDDKCRTSRRFGSGEDRVTLWIDQGGETPSYNLTAIGRPLRNPYGPALTVQFSPEPEYTRYYIAAKSSKGRPVISLFGARMTPTSHEIDEMADRGKKRGDEDVDLADAEIVAIVEGITAERIAAITDLKLGRALMDPLTLQTGPLTEPLAQLQSCAARLVEKLFDNTAKASESGTGVTTKNVEKWAAIIQQNYPKNLIRAGEEARLGVRLTINTAGRPTYCEITGIVGLTAFNDTVCLLLLKHAEFNPARDSDGEPIVARYATRVTFRLN